MLFLEILLTTDFLLGSIICVLLFCDKQHKKAMFYLLVTVISGICMCVCYFSHTETLTTTKIKEPCITSDGYGFYYKQSDAVLSENDNSGIVLDPNSDSEWIYKELDADEVEICNDLTEFDSSYMRAWSYAWHDKEDIYYEIHIPKNMTLTKLPNSN